MQARKSGDLNTWLVGIQMVVWIPIYHLETGQVKVYYSDVSVIQMFPLFRFPLYSTSNKPVCIPLWPSRFLRALRQEWKVFAPSWPFLKDQSRARPGAQSLSSRDTDQSQSELSQFLSPELHTGPGTFRLHKHPKNRSILNFNKIYFKLVSSKLMRLDRKYTHTP